MSDEQQPQQRIINIDQAGSMDWGKGNQYEANLGALGHVVGAKKLGFNVTRLAPGKAAFPYHFHHNTEELFVVEGSGTVRSADGEHPLRQGDLLLCPTGAEGGHKIANDSDADLVYLAVSNKSTPTATRAPRWWDLRGRAWRSARSSRRTPTSTTGKAKQPTD
jgi:uncharacterized cupin superfamily protein